MPVTERARWALPALAAAWVLVNATLTRVGELNAVLTALTLAWAVLLLPCAFGPKSPNRRGLEPVSPHPAGIPLPLWLFTAYAVGSALVEQTAFGFQNAAVYIILVAVMALAAIWASTGTPMLVLRWMRAAAVTGACVYLGTVAVAGPGSDGIYQARGIGLLAWLGMVAAVPLANRSRRGLVVPVILIAASVLSLSRTSTAVCLLLALALALRDRSRGQVRRILGWMAVAVVTGYLAVTRYAPLRDRFLHNDNEGYGGLTIGTTGRSQMWQATWDSIEESPWVGHGIGSAQTLISDVFGYGFLTHPHNDYLRLWHDFGIVGLVLWVAGMWLLGLSAFQRWRAAETDADRAIHLAAMLAVIGLSLSIVTANMIVYVFVAVPVAVVIGTSLGRARAPGGRTSAAAPATTPRTSRTTGTSPRLPSSVG